LIQLLSQLREFCSLSKTTHLTAAQRARHGQTKTALGYLEKAPARSRTFEDFATFFGGAQSVLPNPAVGPGVTTEDRAHEELVVSLRKKLLLLLLLSILELEHF